MTDHYNQPTDAGALDSRLSSLKHQSQDHSNNNNDHGGRRLDAQRRPRSSSLNSEIMPRFTKSTTVSTTGTNDSQYSQYSGLRVVRAEPSSKTQRESVSVAPGEFIKPRVPARSRRDARASFGSEKSSRSEGHKEFRYYGRHGNQWLFNDFSVTDAVSKGFKRVFGKESGKDWYEERER
jgi:hypothetical protein